MCWKLFSTSEWRYGCRGSLGDSVTTQMLSAMTISGQKFDNIFTKNKWTDPTFLDDASSFVGFSLDGPVASPVSRKRKRM